MIEVVSPGPYATVQDLGRPGYAHLGVPRSGAADAPSLRLANRLVGNAESLAGIELTFGGARLRFLDGAWAALTGAPLTGTAGMGAPFWVPAGGELRLGVPRWGLRTYLAVRGGIAVEPVLGSRSTDSLSGLGPEPLRAGTLLPVGRPEGEISVDLAPLPGPRAAVVGVSPGPRDDWFVPEALAELCARPYTVTPDSNRVGARLRGARLERAKEGELPSEGMVAGAVQVPPSGQPIVFLADHPPTGGYPVIAVVRPADLPVVAQLRPGDDVRFEIFHQRPGDR
ncbi:5-oxoprolinase subunit C family protein [Nonomuraea gerenzanensis]|uniref:Allophanate hydrolase 2 subunit 2 n=1 Tax=Nonomuraea gerenzanensis TaxID=93944 RepID=A0A1M4EKJ6_9ACTN|nr:biotin-dependent carboxyltransferase family protein [Nonomuraea gerenzanensis]UBU10946.1 biotin-dependent carboxyltransferase family protein [Nonomuraea gerenzanensis]SBO99392.1 Allophanate hydrolase 2 subunit 2 [Nonomuraea gerenzanensis]